MNTLDLSPLLTDDVEALAATADGGFFHDDDAPDLPVSSIVRRKSPREIRANPCIMIVDDEPLNVKVTRKYLSLEGYEDFITTTDPSLAVSLIHEQQPDVILLDIMMPEISGLDILEQVRSDDEIRDIPVIVLTASTDEDTMVRALTLGATDFLTKPVRPVHLVPRVRNAIVVKAHQDHLRSYAWQLELEVHARTAELVSAQEELIHCLAQAAEYRDNDTGRHIIRVGLYAGAIARRLGLAPKSVELIEQAARLHDLGKIAIPDSILLKPGKLDPEEFELMKKHCALGQSIFAKTQPEESERVKTHAKIGARIMKVSRSPVVKVAARIALTHHEKWDGSGYPNGLSGEDIPIEGRITAVADVFDALRSKRPYKPPFPVRKCFGILEEGRGSHFDPNVLDAFFDAEEKVLEIDAEYADG